MPGQTYSCRAIILRKVKLGELDLILTAISETGEQLEFIAKGARKPSSPFSSRLELFSCADLLIARGKGLDIAKEARLVQGFPDIRTSMDRTAAASCMSELLERAIQPGLENARLYALLLSGLSHVNSSAEDAAIVLASGFMLKAFAFMGLRPCFNACVRCGSALGSEFDPGNVIWLSVADGGTVCRDCLSADSYLFYPWASITWMHALLMSTFDQISGMDIPREAMDDILQLCQEWAKGHLSFGLRSLTCILRQDSMNDLPNLANR